MHDGPIDGNKTYWNSRVPAMYCIKLMLFFFVITPLKAGVSVNRYFGCSHRTRDKKYLFGTNLGTYFWSTYCPNPPALEIGWDLP